MVQKEGLDRNFRKKVRRRFSKKVKKESLERIFRKKVQKEARKMNASDFSLNK